MMVTVSVFEPPPRADVNECIAINSLSSVTGNLIQRHGEDCQSTDLPFGK